MSDYSDKLTSIMMEISKLFKDVDFEIREESATFSLMDSNIHVYMNKVYIDAIPIKEMAKIICKEFIDGAYNDQ